MLDLFDYDNPPDTLQAKVTRKAKSERIIKEVRADGTTFTKFM